MENDDVKLGTVQTEQSHVSTETDCNAQCSNLDLSVKEKERDDKKTSFPAYLVRVCCPKIEGDEGKPDDTGGVHCEPYNLCLIEVLGNLPGLDGVDRADSDKDHAVDLRSCQKSSEFPRNKYCTELYLLAKYDLEINPP